MRILNQFAKHFGPGGLSGCSFGQWIKILRENRWSIDLPYWPRGFVTTMNSLINTFWHWREQQYHAEIAKLDVADPIFVLGVWRSGTTHLHNLLVQDDRLAAPNLYQVMYPHTFLATEKLSASFTGMFVGKTRPMDNVRLSITDDPQEDEFALSPAGHSFMNTCAFPRTGKNYYRRLLTFNGASDEDIELWKKELMWFYKKLTFRYGRSLVLKSPTHTGKIKTLLEMFPNAKFIHIHRHPHHVIQSTMLMMEKAFAFWCFQRPDIAIEQVMLDYQELMGAYFAQRDFIPTGNFVELAYDELVGDPISTISRVYSELGLPGFSQMRPSLESYLETIAGYTTNQLQPLPKEVQRELARRAPRVFDEWNYDHAGPEAQD